jgi:hypothetical protein
VHGLADFVLVERRPPIVNRLVDLGFVKHLEAIRPDTLDEERLRLKGRGRCINRGRVQVRLAQRESQVGQVRNAIHLSAGRLEEDRRAHAPMDVPQHARGIRIECPRVRLLAGDVGVNGRQQPGLT